MPASLHRTARCLRLFALCAAGLLLAPAQAAAQAHADASQPSSLRAVIAARDSVLFDAFNRCDTTAMGEFFTEDLEFYHDWSGLIGPRETFLRGFADGCRKGEIGRRELVPGSMEVHVMRNVGALQLGTHRFFIRRPEGGETPGSIARFAMLWRENGGTWRVSRVLSFDHRDQPKP